MAEVDVALRALAEAATPGPWEVDETEYTREIVGPIQRGPTRQVVVGQHYGPEDAAFIAAANPTAVLALLDEVERLRSKVERVEALAADEDHEWFCATNPEHDNIRTGPCDCWLAGLRAALEEQP